MAGEVYGSPAFAFTSEMDNFLLNQQKLKHQALMDEIEQKRENRLEESDKLDLEVRRAELAERQKMDEQTLKDKRIESHLRKRENLAPGDIPSSDMIHEADELGIPLRLGAAPSVGQIPAGTETPQLPGGAVRLGGAQPAQDVTNPAARPYLGTQKQEQSDKLAKILENSDPNSPEFRRAAIEYEVVTGRSLPAAAFGAGAAQGTEPIARQDPKRNVVQRLVDGKWVDVTGDLPKGTHFLPQPPDPQLQTLRGIEITDKRNADSNLNDLTDEAVDMLAEQVAKSGRGAAALSGLGWGNASKGTKDRILNRAAQWDSTTGKFRDKGQAGPPPDLSAQSADYQAIEATLRDRTKMASATKIASRTASDNLDLASKSSPRVSRTDSAWVNDIANRFIKGATSAEGLTDFETKIYTAAREYAKVTMGASASVAGLTDSAAKEASKLLNSAQSPKAFAAAVTAMKQDMDNVIREQDRGVTELQGRLRRPGDQPKTDTQRKSPADILKEVTGAR